MAAYRWLQTDTPGRCVPSSGRAAHFLLRASNSGRESVMAGIVRKRGPGEAGNRGAFGAMCRGDAEVPGDSSGQPRDAAGAAPVERVGFDLGTSGPAAFDEHAAAAAAELSEARARMRGHVDALHRAVGDRKNASGAWGKSDEQVFAAAREWVSLADRGAASEATGKQLRKPLRDAQAARERVERAREQVDGLEEAFRIRGGWNRAFLVANANGHVHSSTSCSTCRPTTQYAWMTDYSGADEETIVADAGYRACTACYPSAPVGDERSLPTKMLTDEEKQDAKRRERARAAREAKKAKAAANAPTATGEPLTVRSGTSQYPETLKTERTARSWAINEVLNEASFVAYRAQVEGADTTFPGSAVHPASRAPLLQALADKHGPAPRPPP